MWTSLGGIAQGSLSDLRAARLIARLVRGEALAAWPCASVAKNPGVALTDRPRCDYDTRMVVERLAWSLGTLSHPNSAATAPRFVICSRLMGQKGTENTG